MISNTLAMASIRGIGRVRTIYFFLYPSKNALCAGSYMPMPDPSHISLYLSTSSSGTTMRGGEYWINWMEPWNQYSEFSWNIYGFFNRYISLNGVGKV
jgi:hypothetical protein